MVSKTRKGLYAFGSNGSGQLGITHRRDVNQLTLVRSPPPVEDADIVAIKGGGNHTLIMMSNGHVYGSGLNDQIQLGDETIKAKPENRNGIGTVSRRNDNKVGPHFPANLVAFEKIAEDVELCACTDTTSAFVRHETGQNPGSLVYTTGKGKYGELGRGMGVVSTLEHRPDNQVLTTDLRFEPRVVDITGALNHYVVVLEDGSVHGWGKGRHHQIGSKTDDLWAPESIPLEFKAVKAVAGRDFTFIAGTPESGDYIILSTGIKYKDGPKDIKGWKEIHCSWNAIYVLFDDGTVSYWGSDSMAQKPPRILPPVDTMTVGSVHVLAKLTTGQVATWGWGHHGNCLSPTDGLPHGLVEDRFNVAPLDGECKFLGSGGATSFIEVHKVVELSRVCDV